MSDSLPPAEDGDVDPQLADWLRSQLEDDAAGAALGAGYQAAVRLFRSPFGDIVVKRPHESPLLGRIALATIRREYRVYRRLQGVAGIPRALGLVDRRYLVLEHIPGQSLRAAQTTLQNRERFFTLLLETLDAMHSRGVAHGDLKRKDNILVGPEERPYIVDFGIARLSPQAGGGWRKRLFEWFAQADYNAWTKLKYRRRFEALSAEDAARYRPLLLERLARGVRIPWQKLTFRRARKRRRRARQQDLR